ncbi:thiamine pyrophosphokinase-related protein [Thozetella sp. PMI_491]|nr:thiamine pyrophosphokinase-related protein [Thozetella sp. PMI_491]
MSAFSALALLDKVDSWPYFQHDPDQYRRHMEDYYYFFASGVKEPLGYVHRNSVEGMVWPPDAWTVDHNTRFMTLLGDTAGDGDVVDQRTSLLQKTLRLNFDKGRVIRKWYNEALPVRNRHGQHVLDLDLCGVDLFGVVSYGAHLTGYMLSTDASGRREYRYWVPRRSYSKSTFPGMLDNFAAGNLLPNETPLEGMIREVCEETHIPEQFVRQNIRQCGTVTYQMNTTNDGRPGCQHHCQYVFELELLPDMVPVPNDGEVDSFTLMSLSEVKEALMSSEFTPNRSLTYLAHFVRHGLVGSDNEGRIMEVCSRLHRKHELFVV